MVKKIKLRPLSDVTSDIEPLLQEMVDSHGMQAHEILGIIYFYLLVHRPEAIEEYEDGGRPIPFFYGPSKD